MTYFNRQWANEIQLPDGTVATCKADIERYMKTNRVVLTQDYSPECMKRILARNDKARKDELFAEFIFNYKRMIWNE
ncbi:MAG: hypothetical protein IJ479_02450 [Alphaproteobacteria bacterium]|nr:hypothetical protein [Alphaproteobacteria bacterium]